MARGSGGIRYYVDGDTSGLDRALGRADNSISRVGSRLARGALVTGAVAAGAALTGMAAAIKIGFDEVREAQDATAQTEARLKSTAGAANVNAAQVERLASRYQSLTGIQDDVIQSGENVLLTFTNVRNEIGAGNDIFNRAVRSSLDLSVAFGKDLNGSVIMLGKALNDPVKGITALGRAGVQFTAQQREQITTLHESGRTLQAQKIILAELDKQIGGSSAAAGDTLNGKWERLKRTGENVAETITGSMIPSVERLADRALSDLAPKMEQAAGRIAKVWETPGLTPGEKFSESWDAFAATGVPEGVKQAIYTGLETVGTQGPRFILKGLQEAPWPAKGVMAAILLAKIGPAFQLLGGRLGSASGGAGGALGRGGPVPVIVTNPGFGGGAPGAPGLPGGKLPGRAGAVIPGLGTLAPGGGIALPLAAGAGLILGGMALNSRLDRTGIGGGILPSAAEARRATDAALSAQIEAWRKGGPALEREIQKHTLVPAGPLAQRMAESASKGVAAFRAGISKQRTGAKRSGDEIVAAAMQGLAGLSPAAGRLAADSMIRMARSLEDNGRAPKGSTARLMAAIEKEIGKLPSRTRDAARRSAASFGELLRSLQTVQDSVADTVRSIDGLGSRTITPGESRRIRLAIGGASGALLGGTYRGRDEFLAPVAPGEAILTPTQQRLADGGMSIMQALRATGGRVEGYAKGGIIGEAYARAMSKMGASYRYGVFDCSKFATFVAGVNVGGTTASAWTQSRPVRGGEAIVWGFRNNASNDVYDGGKDEHMGVGILTPKGTYRWFDNGGGGVQSDANSARWEHVRVPAGLENVHQESEDTKENTRRRGRERKETPLQRVTRLLGASGVVRDNTPAAGRVGRDLLRGVPDLSGNAGGTSFTPAQDRAIAGAGRTASATARGLGRSPEEAAEAGREAERAAEVKFLRRNVSLEQEDLSILRMRKATLLKDFQRLGRKKVKTPAARAAKRKLRRQYRAKLDDYTQEMTEVREVIAEINARLAEIGEEVAQEQYQEDYEAAEAGRQADEEAAGAVAAGPSADQQAQLDQANARADVAENEARASDAFLRSLRGAGDIDPAAGSVTINQYIAGTVVERSRVASWIVEAMNEQGNRTTSVSRSAA